MIASATPMAPSPHCKESGHYAVVSYAEVSTLLGMLRRSVLRRTVLRRTVLYPILSGLLHMEGIGEMRGRMNLLK